MPNKIRIAYVEDHRIVREGVNHLLAQFDDIEVVTEEIDFDRIDAFMNKHHIRVFVLDLQLTVTRERKDMNGFDLCSFLKARFPETKTLAHTMYDSIEFVNRYFTHGGDGFVSKKSGHLQLYDAIKHVAGGHKYICPEIIRKSRNAEKFLRGTEPRLKAVSELFTPTESNVLERIARGYSTKQIAHQLKISEKTVETHRKHLFDKAKVKNVAELIAFAYARKIFME